MSVRLIAPGHSRAKLNDAVGDLHLAVGIQPHPAGVWLDASEPSGRMLGRREVSAVCPAERFNRFVVQVSEVPDEVDPGEYGAWVLEVEVELPLDTGLVRLRTGEKTSPSASALAYAVTDLVRDVAALYPADRWRLNRMW
jgi:hypothetical protein